MSKKKDKLTTQQTPRNFVAKHMAKFHRARRHEDKRKKEKHKRQHFDPDE